MHSAATTLLYRMFGLDYYDSLLLTGDFQVEEIKELEEIRKDPEKEIKVVGCTYMDELKRRLDESGPLERKDDIKTLLLAPSWGDTAILKVY